MFRVLLDNAEFVSRPAVNAAVEIDNRDAMDSEAQRITVAQ
jgi:hypothetical protein